MPRHIRVLFVNTYDMHDAKRLFTIGCWPSQHLFGTLELEKSYGMEIITLQHARYPILNKIGAWFDIPFLDQELRTLISLSKCDIVYAPYAATNTRLLAFFKHIGLIHKPVLILVHQDLFGKPSGNRLKHWLAKYLIASYDALLFFSSSMKRALIQTYSFDPLMVENRFGVTLWGTDPDFYAPYLDNTVPAERGFILTSGHTGRDFDLVVRIARRINFPFKIYCRDDSFPAEALVDKPDNVEILCGTFPFNEICDAHKRARMVLIPLREDYNGMMGLTSFLDALAIGRVIVMTRNRNFDIDLHKENIGIGVEPNTDDAWVVSINSILYDFDRLRKMELNARRLAVDRINMEAFAQDVATAIRKAVL